MINKQQNEIKSEADYHAKSLMGIHEYMPLSLLASIYMHMQSEFKSKQKNNYPRPLHH